MYRSFEKYGKKQKNSVSQRCGSVIRTRIRTKMSRIRNTGNHRYFIGTGTAPVSKINKSYLQLMNERIDTFGQIL